MERGDEVGGLDSAGHHGYSEEPQRFSEQIQSLSTHMRQSISD